MHLPIFVFFNGDDRSFSGTYTHFYEICLYLEDCGFSVYFIACIDHTKHIVDFSNRYTKNLHIYTVEDLELQYISKYNVIIYGFYKNEKFINFLQNANKIFYLITDGALDNFINNLTINYKTRLTQFFYKLEFLYDEDLPNPLQDSIAFKQKDKHKCSWGIYDKYLNITKEQSDKYFIYARLNNTRSLYYINTYSDETIVNKAIEYCHTYNLQYVLDKREYNDPWNKYKGLIYTRNIDYSPRLPFEFGLANKSTICFDTSPGLEILAEDCTLYKPIVMKTKKKLQLPLELFK